jgi:uncharacterized membrane protein
MECYFLDYCEISFHSILLSSFSIYSYTEHETFRITAIPLSFITLLLLATFPGWYEEEDDDGEREVKPFPSRSVSIVALYAILIACLFTFIAVLVQHVASATGSTMVESLSYGTVRGKVGSASHVMGWTGLVLYVIVASGLGVVIFDIMRHNSEVEAESEGDGGSVEVGDD